MTMNMTEISEILKRVEKLEMQNRRKRQMGLAVFLLIVSVFVIAQVSPTKVIEAEKLVIRYPEGMEACVIQLAQGFPEIKLVDRKGFDLARLLATSDGAQLTLRAPEYSIETIVAANGSSALGGQNTGPSGGISIRPFPKTAAGAIYLGSNRNGSLQLDIVDANRSRIVVGSLETMRAATGEKGKTSAASIVMFDKSGPPIWKAP
jgi:hypothetical protein